MHRRYFGYIRVSTAKQGEKGVSLQEQHDAIALYAQRFGLELCQWFEERESAAKRGRPLFAQMLVGLRRGEAQGVVIHKIDRSARNLKDWADLGELIDSGIEVHFANESLDLHTRGGRLSADIQAVVAADYIRNLREETKKGFYGRLKQGVYPLPAPIGYLDRGKGRVKEPDPIAAPIISKAFELYETGGYSLNRLLEEVTRRGLRNRHGTALSLTGLSTVLNNPFYAGLIRIRRTGEMFAGNHRPLVRKLVFDRVSSILRGKTVDRLVRHDFTYRRLVRCTGCKRSLIGELQKSHVYYRCQTRGCPTKTVREELIDTVITRMMTQLEFDNSELECFQERVKELRMTHDVQCEEQLRSCRLQLDGVKARLNRLTDALLDGLIEKLPFEERRATLGVEEKEIQATISGLEAGINDSLRQLERFLELVKNAPFVYKQANPGEKRELLRNLTSNLSVTGKNVSVEPKASVSVLLNRPKLSHGAPSRDVHRTLRLLVDKIMKVIQEERAPMPDRFPFACEAGELAA